MLTIEVPELRRYNPEFFRQLFDRLWPNFQIGHLGEGLHVKHIEDIFYVDSVSITMDTFTRAIDEMVQAVNLKRPLDLDYVTFDYNDYMDTYSFEDPEVPAYDMLRLEGLMFEFFHYLIEAMISPEFLAVLTAQMNRIWTQLAGIVGSYGVVGIWYEPYVGGNNMWVDGDKVFGIQQTDFQVIHVGVWDGMHSNSTFYPHSDDADNEFYWYQGSMVKASSGNNIIPRGETVSLCRLKDEIVRLMDQ
ncbi:hypothetical protein pEaSNUABM8_00237 [Erwinia phage pEa_SNUABM_8]|nr:hypothetical protein pEaSNUABM8_00237 [Erwinia phage pEa_SNUABM_8]QVW54989.1 hypothetical protein pEaSNUABM4_00236 [Erwinia phage pEa_SNUABM_4]